MGFDFRYALRMLRKRPLFSTVILVTIALGISATTTMFSVVHAVLLDPLPYPAADRLAFVWEHQIERGNDQNVVSPANYIAWREQSTSFESLAAFGTTSASITGDGDPERIGMIYSTVDLLPMLGSAPVRGRLFEAGEDRSGAPLVAVLGESFWRRRFGADPAVIGRTIRLNDAPYTVVGILPATLRFDAPTGFNFTGTYDVWVPFQITEQHRTWGGRYLQVLGRIRPGLGMEAARAEIVGLAQRLEREFPDRNAGYSVNLVPMREQVVGDVSLSLLVIFGAVSFVLLIACANVANLLLTRATERHQEVAVRVAIGASRSRIARQLVAESLTLALAGGALGLLLSAWGVSALAMLAPDIPRLDGVGLSTPVLLFALGVSLFTGLLFGIAPVMHILRSDLAIWLRGRGGEGGRREARRTRAALVVAEIALSLMLLIGAGLLGRSLLRMIDVGVGFETDNLLTATLDLPNARYPEGPRSIAFFEELIDRVQRLPGVEGATAITFVPLGGPGSATRFWANDRPVPGPGEQPVADIRWVHHDYHRVMGIPVLRGRSLDETDGSNAPLRVVISESLQQQLWPDENPIGKSLSMPWGDTLVAEVVGVVADVKHDGPRDGPRSMIYWHHVQFEAMNMMTLVVRATNNPLAAATGVRAQLAEMDPSLPLYDVTTMQSRLSDALKRARFAAVSLGVFAVVALALALIGVYGVMSYATGQRVREFGVRLALGADPGDVTRLVLSQGIRIIALALVVGVTGAVALSRILQGLVFEVGTLDPLTFIGMAALLTLTALAACWIPARRASAINPVSAMRID